jgi:hypothetical protein
MRAGHIPFACQPAILFRLSICIGPRTAPRLRMEIVRSLLQLSVIDLDSLFRSYLPQDYHIVQEVEKTRASLPTQKVTRIRKFSNFSIPVKLNQTDTGYAYSQDDGTAETIAIGRHGKKHL